MRNQSIVAALAAGLSILPLMAQPAAAAVVTLPNGSVVDYTQNNATQGGSGSFSGTVQQGGATSNFACSYDAVTGLIGGGGACAQILNGLGLPALERQLVAARVNAASHFQSEANLFLLSDLLQRRIGGDFTLRVQASGEGIAGSAGSGFSAAGLGPTAFGGGSFLDDNRPGFEKSGESYVFTVGVDHAAGNTLLGGFVGYMNTDLDLTSLAGNLSSDGWVAGVYATQVLGPIFSVTASGFYSDANNDLRRTFAGAPVTASYGHDEWSGSLQANALLINSDDLAFSVLGGLTYGAWSDNAHTDSRGIAFGEADGDNTYAKVGGVLTFMPTAVLRPYVQATYNRLLSDPAYNGRDALSLGGGVAVGSGRITGSAEVGTVVLQSGQNNTSVGLHLRLAL